MTALVKSNHKQHNKDEAKIKIGRKILGEMVRFSPLRPTSAYSYNGKDRSHYDQLVDDCVGSVRRNRGGRHSAFIRVNSGAIKNN